MAAPAGKRLGAVAAALAVVLTAAVGTWWLLRDPAPYALRKTPAVDVTVHAVTSDYPEAGELAGDVDPLLKVYVQRLAAGDATDLARLGAPWYTGRERAARQLISRYGAQAGEPVDALVRDPVVPYLAAVELRFGDGRRQEVRLTRDDHVWWLQLGDGDPVAP
ncbi:hypothetical protein [Streptomyces cinerochromogenes]|uniref:hypothetical protein n=1 Tax=Streptomyces cinerochromogenes TaxID=66422 RepID=UPI0033ACDDBC